MYGNTLTRSLNAFRHMLMRPHHACRWAENRISKKPPIDQGLPWFSYTAIDRLNSWIQPGMKVLEWGGGGSTVYFAQRGCKVTTVEDHEGWAGKFRQRLTDLKLDGQVEVRLIPANDRTPNHVRGYVESFLNGGPWDVVIIDGLEEDYISRMDCVRFVAQNLGNVQGKGVVILDDSWRPKYDETPKILSALRHEMHWGLGPSRWGVTRTDFYWKNA